MQHDYLLWFSSLPTSPVRRSYSERARAHTYKHMHTYMHTCIEALFTKHWIGIANASWNCGVWPYVSRFGIASVPEHTRTQPCTHAYMYNTRTHNTVVASNPNTSGCNRCPSLFAFGVFGRATHTPLALCNERAFEYTSSVAFTHLQFCPWAQQTFQHLFWPKNGEWHSAPNTDYMHDVAARAILHSYIRTFLHSCGPPLMA